jgi:uncharacterized peroxidase-related enzyme
MVTLDEGLAAAIKEDWREAPLDERDRTMLTYVEKVTLTPTRCTREDIEILHAAGFDDQAVLQINMIASMFCYLNRVADGLGVGKE